MSNIYIKEPATNGKVILKTTLGDIDCELWSREAPKACRNFVQLCIEGYYDGSIFHRVLKGFIAQGGDPTGTGYGGDSIYGDPFKDELHSRLRFVRRGLIAMANSEKDSNGSQFFFTLGACPELQDKHTIFGKVTGNTLYNMIKFDDLQVDQNDKPLYPPRILSTEVVFNPFEDIVPRKKEAKKPNRKDERPQVKATKDFKLLSFGDEAEEEEEAVGEVVKKFKGKSKSSHDLLDDPKLSSIPAVEPSLAAINHKRLKGDIKSSDEESDSCEEGQKSKSTKSRKLDTLSKIRNKFITSNNPFGEGTSKDFIEPLDDDPMIDFKQLKLEKLKSESKELKKSLVKVKPKAETKSIEPEKQLAPEIVDLKNEIMTLKSKKKDKKSKNLEDTLSKFEKFKQKLSLEQSNESAMVKSDNADNSVTNNKTGDRGDQSVPILPTVKAKTKLKLANHKMICEESEPVLAKDANLFNEADWFSIYDPRHPVNKRRREQGDEPSTSKKAHNNNNNNHDKRR